MTDQEKVAEEIVVRTKHLADLIANLPQYMQDDAVRLIEELALMPSMTVRLTVAMSVKRLVRDFPRKSVPVDSPLPFFS